MAQAHTTHDGSHGSYQSYITGFVLAVVLTVASFAAVMTHALAPGMALAALGVLAVVQIVVHLVFFLHLNTSNEQSWNLMCFIFAAASVIIIVGGTLFIMHDTAINMMSR